MKTNKITSLDELAAEYEEDLSSLLSATTSGTLCYFVLFSKVMSSFSLIPYYKFFSFEFFNKANLHSGCGIRKKFHWVNSLIWSLISFIDPKVKAPVQNPSSTTKTSSKTKTESKLCSVVLSSKESLNEIDFVIDDESDLQILSTAFGIVVKKPTAVFPELHSIRTWQPNWKSESPHINVSIHLLDDSFRTLSVPSDIKAKVKFQSYPLLSCPSLLTSVFRIFCSFLQNKLDVTRHNISHSLIFHQILAKVLNTSFLFFNSKQISTTNYCFFFDIEIVAL